MQTYLLTASISMTLRKRHGFSYVEILVTLGIIILLLAILLPTITKVREESMRVQCSSNLHQYGVVCMMFASDHNQMYPPCWTLTASLNAGGTNWTAAGFQFRPHLINYQAEDITTFSSGNATSGAPMAGVPLWQLYGAPLQMILPYCQSANNLTTPEYMNGVADGKQDPVPGFFSCPETGRGNIYLDTYSNPTSAQYRNLIQVSYMYMAGTLTRTPTASAFNYGTRAPASRQDDQNCAAEVIAADEYFWNDTSPSNYYDINHVQTGKTGQTAWQNILFGDGHVEGWVPSFRDATTGKMSPQPSTNNWSLSFDSTGTTKWYFYWGQ